MNTLCSACFAAILLLSSNGQVSAKDLKTSILPVADVAIDTGPEFSAMIEGWGGNSFVFGRTGSAIEGGELDSMMTYGGSARFGVMFPPGIYVQGDLVGERTTADTTGNNNFISAYSFGGHAGYTNTDFLIGGFGVNGKTFAETEESDFWAYGAEARFNLSSTSTIYGQVGYLQASGAEFIHDALFVRGKLDFAVSDSAKLGGELSYASGKQGPNDARIFGWGVRFDQNFGGSPISGFIAYDGTSYDNGVGSYVDNVAKLGLQIHFGSGGNGGYSASLDTPNIGRWVAAGNSID